MKTYVRAPSLDGLPETAKEAGKELAPLIKRFGLSEDVFHARETEVDFDLACDLLEACSESWNMNDVGVRMASFQALDTFGVIALSVRMERSVRTALLAIMRNFFIHSNAILVDLEEDGETAAIVLNFRSDGTEMRQFGELALCVAKTVLDIVVQEPVTPVLASALHSHPEGRDALAQSLGCPVDYEAERYALYFDTSLLDIRLEQTDVAFHPIIRKYLAEASVHMTEFFPAAVRLEVFRQLALGELSQTKVAAALRIQPRTMQRRLQEDGTSFRAIVEEERRRRSLSLVQQTNLPLSEVALAAGYSDQTAFNQAFRRWFGRSPLKVRRGQARLAPPT